MADEDSPELLRFKRETSSSRVGRSEYAGSVALSKLGTDLDATFNFRLNSGLKIEFEKLCKANHTNSAREIKRFMTEAVRAQRLIQGRGVAALLTHLALSETGPYERSEWVRACSILTNPAHKGQMPTQGVAAPWAG